jgi:hypothetical protein
VWARDNGRVDGGPPPNERLEIGPDVAAVLRPEEAVRLSELSRQGPLRCPACRRSIDPAGAAPLSVSLTLEGEAAVAEFAHAACAPSRADLARLVTVADADPLGITFVQASHPQAGAVLLWERRLDVRVREGGRDVVPYLDAQRLDGFHPALHDEPVHELAGLRLARDGPDLVLWRGRVPGERFHDAAGRPPAGWLEALEASGYGLLVVGADLGLRQPNTDDVQRAMRAGRALMGLVEFAER